MTTRTDSRRWAAVVAVLACAGALVGAGSAPAQSITPDDVMLASKGLEQNAITRLGTRFGCVTNPGWRGGAPTIRFAVTTPAARAAAYQLAREVGVLSVTRVVVVRPRYGWARRSALIDLLGRRVRAHHWKYVQVGSESPVDLTRCPRVTVTVLQQASGAQRAWAALQQTRYWDRVMAVEVHPMPWVPTVCPAGAACPV